jgi:flavin reductase (DIM6/NTAB) family NADH-FMN oxidoreductase RutF
VGRTSVSLGAVAEPGGAGPVGPYPAGVDSEDQRVEYDKLRRRVLWKMPTGLYVIGSRSADHARMNLMTANWVVQLSFAPKLVGIGVEHAALTHDLVDDGGVFTVCFVDREDRAIVRRFTKPTELDASAQTLNGFPFLVRTTGAPVLSQSVAFLDCEVRERVGAGNHTLFIGEVVDCGFLREEDTPVLRMEDTRMNYGG